MSPSTRIQRTNRREHGSRGPTLPDALLRVAIAALAFVGLFWRRDGSPKPEARTARASEVQQQRYEEWLMIEGAVTAGRMSREDADRYWRRKGSA